MPGPDFLQTGGIAASPPDGHPSKRCSPQLWERAMDGFVLGLFLFAAFIGGFASGLAGFAMGFVVSGIWLHVITPIQTTALNRRLRPVDAGLRRMEVAADAELADRRTIHHRRGAGRSSWRCAANVSRSGACALWRRRIAGHLQRVRPD